MSPNLKQNQQHQSKSGVKTLVKSGHTGIDRVSREAFVDALTRIRRSFAQVKEATECGDLEAAREAVKRLESGLEALEEGAGSG